MEFLPFNLGTDDKELISAVAITVISSKCVDKKLPSLLQSNIAFVMAILIIYGLEIVHIQHHGE